jgi:hypothetical protein
MTNVNSDAFQRSSSRGNYTRRLELTTGTAYGIIFGLGFALFAWGYDAWVLASNGAAIPWVKLLIGLPIAVVICGLAGLLGALPSSTAVTVALWAVIGGLLGMIAGHIPFEGENFGIWLVERRLWGETIFAYTDSALVRTTLIIIINVVLGAAVGFIEKLTLNWSWDHTTPGGRMSWRSWLVLFFNLPLAFLLAASVNGLINQPLRNPQQVVGKLLKLTLAGKAENNPSIEISYRSIKPFQDVISGQYESHFVAFSSETGIWHSAYIDVVFDDGLVLRCVTSGEVVIYCDDFSQWVAEWVNELVRAGLYGEIPWKDARIKRLVVEDSVVLWLTAHRDQLSENYVAIRDGQQSNWFFERIRFDTGFEMLCRFSGTTPVIVDQCVELSELFQ